MSRRRARQYASLPLLYTANGLLWIGRRIHGRSESWFFRHARDDIATGTRLIRGRPRP